MEAHGLVEIMTDMTKGDTRRLKRLIENHKHYTDSQRAKHILDNWKTYLPRFVKVMPVDYRAALQKMAQTSATA
jgi:glutamate synthase (NADPH/NADH) large chain